MIEVNSSDFPQKVESQSSVPQQPASVSKLKGPRFYKEGENVTFFRPYRVLDYRDSSGTVVISCEARAYVHRTVRTHETSMHQMKAVDHTPSVLDIHIQIWSPDIFRIIFGKSPVNDKSRETSGLRINMLIGSPDIQPRYMVDEDAGNIRITTDKIVLNVKRELLHISASNKQGEVFWEQARSELFTSDILEISYAECQGKTGCFEAFHIRNHDEIYGLGERFDHLSRRGVETDFWNKDAIGTSNTRTYINVPFLLSTQGYGLFVNSSCRTEWEVGTAEASTLGFSVDDDIMDYFIIYGPSPKEILYKYSCLTGFSPTPPIWSFGLWMSRNSYLSWDVVFKVAEELRRRGIPADVLHLDTAWFKEDWNCDLRFSPERFGNPEGNMKKLKDTGFRVSLWQCNFVPPRDNNENYRTGLEKGYFALDDDGKPYSFSPETPGMWLDDATIDFSDPDACTWYCDQIKELIKMGASTIKTDFGEGIPEDAVYKNIEGRRFHNLYSLIYNSAISDTIYEVTGERIVWARSGTAGSQRYPIHWGGDSQCSWGGLSGTLRGALSLGLSGFPFFSHDIGGFIGKPSPELYIRWAQFGLFSSHSRCHGGGNNNSREPWAFGEDAERIFRKYSVLRYRLMPYIYSEALKASKTAVPMVRALVIEYPDDRNTYHIDDQYMFGDALLVAPVLAPIQKEKSKSVYLPKGCWYDYWTKAWIISAGEWIKVDVNIDTMPIYVKAGSVIPYGAEKLFTNNEIGPIELLEIYSGCDVDYNYSDGSRNFTVELTASKPKVNGLDSIPEIVIY